MSLERSLSEGQFFEIDSSVQGYMKFWSYHGPTGFPATHLSDDESPDTPTADTPSTDTLMITHNPPDRRGYSWFIHL